MRSNAFGRREMLQAAPFDLSTSFVMTSDGDRCDTGAGYSQREDGGSVSRLAASNVAFSS
jgi:hypothetical protein